MCPSAHDPSRSFTLPADFVEEVEVAVRNKRLGDLELLAYEASGFDWSIAGLRLVGRAQYNLKAFHGALGTWERVLKSNSADVEAKTLLGTIYQQLGAPVADVAEAYSPKSRGVLLFAGHMIDKPDCPKPRFPAEKEAMARKAIRSAIEEEARTVSIAYGIAGGANGGDILFHEVCAELGIPTQLYLALPPQAFTATSVGGGGPQWVERFNRLLNRHPETRVLAKSEELPGWLAGRKDGYVIWTRNNLWLLYNALAEQEKSVTLIALWNGEKGYGPGGTADLVGQAEQRGSRVVILDTRKLFGLS